VVKLQVRDLRTGRTHQESFATEALAIAWLQARPRHSEVLGIAMAGIDAALDARLRAACRPLSAAERVLRDQVQAAADAARQQHLAELQQRELAALDQHRQALAEADPDRPLELRYRFDRGLSLSDSADPREISAAARAAVAAWIAERHEWLQSRRQVIGEATLTVWPGPLPAGTTERVVSGSFIPVTAPADDEDDC
jgi:hypothetical protein